MTSTNSVSTPPDAANGDPHDSPAEQLVRLVYWTSRAGRHLRRCLGEAAGFAALTDSELLTIWLCLDDEGGGMVQGELATALGVSPAQMSGIVERLRQRGLIEMHRQALDRRRQLWRGTAAAKELFALLAKPLAEIAAGIAACVPASDQETAQSLCRRLALSAESQTEVQPYKEAA
jgi:DNA-binding MarR family transcriptional regulator